MAKETRNPEKETERSELTKFECDMNSFSERLYGFGGSLRTMRRVLTNSDEASKSEAVEEPTGNRIDNLQNILSDMKRYLDECDENFTLIQAIVG